MIAMSKVAALSLSLSVNRIYATVAHVRPPFFRDRPTYERIVANARVAKNQFIDVFWYVVHT